MGTEVVHKENSPSTEMSLHGQATSCGVGSKENEKPFLLRLISRARANNARGAKRESVSLAWGTACRGYNERSVLTGRRAVYATLPSLFPSCHR